MILPLQSIALLKPCCFGDVMFTTPLLGVLRRAYPTARIDYLTGAYSRPAVEANPLIDNRVELPRGTLAAAQLLRKGRYDAVIVPDRSGRLALTALISGIPVRAGLDSAGRGLPYSHRAPTSPADVRHEAEIYLELARALGLPVEAPAMEYTPPAADRKLALGLLEDAKLTERPFILIHPGGGRNPGMQMDSKRWPPPNFAQLAIRAGRETGLPVCLAGGLGDEAILNGVAGMINIPFRNFGPLPWGRIGALAERCALYIGNDTGATHMAVGAGARVIMILGPSDPRRYGPYGAPDRAAYVWRPWNVPTAGVSAGAAGFSWDNGATVADVIKAVVELLERKTH